jgi:hypothetical protein
VIDLVAYINACARPYDDGEHNCFSTALVAFPSSRAAGLLRDWWRSLPADRQEKLARGDEQIDLDAFASTLRLQPASEPTGNELGVIKQLDCAPPIFVVGANGSWFARGKRRAVRVPPHLVTKAWRVA